MQGESKRGSPYRKSVSLASTHCVQKIVPCDFQNSSGSGYNPKLTAGNQNRQSQDTDRPTKRAFCCIAHCLALALTLTALALGTDCTGIDCTGTDCALALARMRERPVLACHLIWTEAAQHFVKTDL